MMTTMAPDNIPLTAPVLLNPFQYKDKSTSGPNAAPKPAHALPTRPKMVSLGDQAIQIETIATMMTDNRPTKTNSFHVPLQLPHHELIYKSLLLMNLTLLTIVKKLYHNRS